MPEVLDESHTILKYLKEGQQHIAYVIPVEDNRFRGLSVANFNRSNHIEVSKWFQTFSKGVG